MAKLLADDGRPDDGFGLAVDIEGDIAAVGAPAYDAGPIAAGTVYLFERDAGGTGRWEAVQRITAPDPKRRDGFGTAIALDGDLIVAGAPLEDQRGEDAGAVYVFEHDISSGPWRQTRKLTALQARADSFFGGSVAVVGDALAATAKFERGRNRSSGAVYMNIRAAGSRHWIESARLTAADSDAGHGGFFGDAMDFDGDTLLIGVSSDGERAEAAGAVYFLTTDPDAPVLPGP